LSALLHLAETRLSVASNPGGNRQDPGLAVGGRKQGRLSPTAGNRRPFHACVMQDMQLVPAARQIILEHGRVIHEELRETYIKGAINLDAIGGSQAATRCGSVADETGLPRSHPAKPVDVLAWFIVGYKITIFRIHAIRR